MVMELDGLTITGNWVVDFGVKLHNVEVYMDYSYDRQLWGFHGVYYDGYVVKCMRMCMWR